MPRNLPVAYSLDDVALLEPQKSVVTLGVFDGVHRGHRSIIETVVARRASGARAIVVTFDPHPVAVTHSRETPPILATLEERLALFSDFDVDGVFVVGFDDGTAKLDYREFIDRYLLAGLDMTHLILGYDCHFGHGREGSPERVAEEGKRRGFAVEVVDPVSFEGSVVSSTEIRNTLLRGDLARANRLLGHPYLVSGMVVHGQGRGSDFGFPTANVAVSDPQKLWPPTGVYAVRVGWREWTFDGMMNVGRAPTVKGDREEIEVHIFDFHHHIYGETISVHCEVFLREERKFPTLDALVDQLTQDRRTAQEILAGMSSPGR